MVYVIENEGVWLQPYTTAATCFTTRRDLLHNPPRLVAKFAYRSVANGTIELPPDVAQYEPQLASYMHTTWPRRASPSIALRLSA